MNLSKNSNLWIGMILVSAMFLLMLVSFVYLPHNVNEMNIGDRLASPSRKHLLGTDNFGRDILSRVMEGSQTAFTVGFFSVAIGITGGLVIGAASGYLGKWVDEILMRLMDALLAFPGIIIALVLVSIFKPDLTQTIIAVGIFFIPGFARIIRSGFLAYKKTDFVTAARHLGAGHLRIIVYHILPNILSPIIVAASLNFSAAILIEAALSYLGLGVQPPDPSWGRMLNESQSYIYKAPWYTLAPGIFITLTVLGFNLLGDGIRDWIARKD
ncbi:MULTISPECIES: ABC transporter permease [Bacillus]|jgi:peptide/nickel transport system permease protein|uniref:ABC transporter permease n=1 Tax=Bacillus TaxID=1386 RepID=UPI00065E5009|nr:ABC transporter permease [Bacillus smithii]AKP47108.1 Dipeptide transport system permease protein DppC TC 3.A.1.5.2 [Bacillus smithii]